MKKIESIYENYKTVLARQSFKLKSQTIFFSSKSTKPFHLERRREIKHWKSLLRQYKSLRIPTHTLRRCVAMQPDVTEYEHLSLDEIFPHHSSKEKKYLPFHVDTQVLTMLRTTERRQSSFIYGNCFSKDVRISPSKILFQKSLRILEKKSIKYRTEKMRKCFILKMEQVWFLFICLF